MGLVTMIYEARCKHCIHFKGERRTKKDGTTSKWFRYRCAKGHRDYDLTMKTKSCENLEL